MITNRERDWKQKRERVLLIRLFLAVLLLAVAAIAAAVIERVTPSRKQLSPKDYYGTGEGEAALIKDGCLLEEKALIREGTLYLPYTYVRTIAPWIFYDTEEELLICTGALTKEVFSFENGTTSDGEAFLSDDGMYVSAVFLEQHVSMRPEYLENPTRLSFWTKNTRLTAKAAADSVIRLKAGIKSPIIRKMEEGETLILLDVNPDGSPKEEKTEKWTHVSTEDGFSGYMKDKDLSGDFTEEEISLSEGPGVYTRQQIDGKLNMVFHQTTDQASNNALVESVNGMSGVNAIAPTWFFLDDTGGTVRSIASASYVETAHGMGLKVYAVLNDFDGEIHSASETAEVLGNNTSRSAIVENVMEGIRESGADGLNIDIELVKEESADCYLELLREFSAELRKEGKTLLTDTFVPKFTGYLNRTEQARVADYVVLMCYDEHTSGSPEAGSVSSLSFVEEGVRSTLNEVPKEQLIAALPFYTRLWQTGGSGEVESRAYGMSDAAQAIEAQNIPLAWDEECGQNYGELQSGDILYQIWVEDADSLKKKMEMLSTYDLAGIAEWKLGLETKDIWEVLNEGLSSF